VHFHGKCNKKKKKKDFTYQTACARTRAFRCFMNSQALSHPISEKTTYTRFSSLKIFCFFIPRKHLQTCLFLILHFTFISIFTSYWTTLYKYQEEFTVKASMIFNAHTSFTKAKRSRSERARTSSIKKTSLMGKTSGSCSFV